MQLMEKVPLYHNQRGDSKIIILYPIQNLKNLRRVKQQIQMKTNSFFFVSEKLKNPMCLHRNSDIF